MAETEIEKVVGRTMDHSEYFARIDELEEHIRSGLDRYHPLLIR